MARPLRIEYEHALYHVTSRGNARNAIFKDEFDKQIFLDVIGDAFERYGFIIHAFALMTNHYHVLMETPLPNLSACMHHINAVYTQAYNRRHKVVGHVLQGRFKAIVVERDEYYLELIRYIHLNPIRGHMLEDIDTYVFSGHKALIDAAWARRWPWYERDRVLASFGDDEQSACARYREFLDAGLGLENPMKNVTAGSFLGSKEFVETLWNKFVEGRTKHDVTGVAVRPFGLTADDVVDAICTMRGVGPDALTASRRGRGNSNNWRDLAMFLLRKHSAMTHAEIGAALGGIGPQAVSTGVKRFRDLMECDEHARLFYNDALNQLKKPGSGLQI